LYFKAIKKASKKRYNNIKVGGCPSIKHFKRKGELLLLEQNGQITNLREEVPFEIIVCGQYVCSYIADFTYIQDGECIVEDVKGRISAEYSIKRKLMQAIHKIKILET